MFCLWRSTQMILELHRNITGSPPALLQSYPQDSVRHDGSASVTCHWTQSRGTSGFVTWTSVVCRLLQPSGKHHSWPLGSTSPVHWRHTAPPCHARRQHRQQADRPCHMCCWHKMVHPLVVGTSHQLRAVMSIMSTLSVTGVDLPAADDIRVLWVMLDWRLAFDKHASAVAWSCNYHVQAIRHISHLLTTELTRTLACSLRIYSCNAVHHEAHTTSISTSRTAQLGSF